MPAPGTVDAAPVLMGAVRQMEIARLKAEVETLRAERDALLGKVQDARRLLGDVLGRLEP